jgi:hypothetical protein
LAELQVTTPRIPGAAIARVPAGTTIIRAERMSPAFTKYHLADGRALHRFSREEPHAHPHDHPWAFETTIIDGGYAEEVFHTTYSGGWRSEVVHRNPGTSHWIAAEHIHRIVALPRGECWTLIRAGAHERETRFWRFGDGVWSCAWNQRRWQWHVPASERQGRSNVLVQLNLFTDAD